MKDVRSRMETRAEDARSRMETPRLRREEQDGDPALKVRGTRWRPHAGNAKSMETPR